MSARKVLFIVLTALVAVAGVTAVAGPLAPASTSPAAVGSPSDLIAIFATAYRTMDLQLYATLLAHEPEHGVGFRFVLDRPSPTGETSWDYDEEMRIHRRMFDPGSIGADEKPLPSALWVRSIDVDLRRLTEFAERYDLYCSEQNPEGELDRKRWRATDAVYATDVTWQVTGGAMRVVGQARFVVIEDLLADAMDRFLIYRWEDLGSTETTVAERQQ